MIRRFLTISLIGTGVACGKDPQAPPVYPEAAKQLVVDSIRYSATTTLVNNVLRTTLRLTNLSNSDKTLRLWPSPCPVENILYNRPELNGDPVLDFRSKYTCPAVATPIVILRGETKEFNVDYQRDDLRELPRGKYYVRSIVRYIDGHLNGGEFTL